MTQWIPGQLFPVGSGPLASPGGVADSLAHSEAVVEGQYTCNAVYKTVI